MSPYPRLVTCAFLFLSVSAMAIERLPVAEFTRSPEVSRASLSPDGAQFAYLADHNRLNTLHVLDLASRKTMRLNLGEAALVDGFHREIGEYQWVGDRRLVVTTLVNDAVYGVIAMDSDGRRTVPLSGLENQKQLRIEGNTRVAASWAREVIHTFGDKDNSILMLDRHQTSGGGYNRPDILRVNTATGIAKTVVKNPARSRSGGWILKGSPASASSRTVICRAWSTGPRRKRSGRPSCRSRTGAARCGPWVSTRPRTG